MLRPRGRLAVTSSRSSFFFLSVVITVVSIYFSVLASKAVAGGGDGLQRAIKRAVS